MTFCPRHRGVRPLFFFLNSNIRSLLPARVTSVKLLCDTSKNTRMSEQLQNKGSTYSSIIIRP